MHIIRKPFTTHVCSCAQDPSVLMVVIREPFTTIEAWKHIEDAVLMIVICKSFIRNKSKISFLLQRYE